jgi:hypothetical protein
MPAEIRNDVRREVLRYLSTHPDPVRMSSMAQYLREQNQSLSGLVDADFRFVVQAMIATGKLSYAPGLKIRLGKAAN